jgi:hypothetical protein
MAMSKGQQDLQVIETVSSFPFVVEISRDDETTAYPSHQTLDMRYAFSAAIPADASWLVISEEDTGR